MLRRSTLGPGFWYLGPLSFGLLEFVNVNRFQNRVVVLKRFWPLCLLVGVDGICEYPGDRFWSSRLLSRLDVRSRFTWRREDCDVEATGWIVSRSPRYLIEGQLLLGVYYKPIILNHILHREHASRSASIIHDARPHLLCVEIRLVGRCHKFLHRMTMPGVHRGVPSEIGFRLVRVNSPLESSLWVREALRSPPHLVLSLFNEWISIAILHVGRRKRSPMTSRG